VGLLAVHADKKGETPAALRQEVTWPRGTTEAALKVIAVGQFGSLVEAALARACRRSRELSA